MDRYLRKKYGRISKLDKLQEAILEAWDTIGEKRLRNLVKSMPDRVKQWRKLTKYQFLVGVSIFLIFFS